MKRIFCYFLFISISFTAFSQNSKNCGFESLYAQNGLKNFFEDREKAYNELRKQFPNAKSDTLIIIPTVVHVIYKNPTENISTQQIQSQIDVLNRDFRKLNADTTNVAAGFSKADIKFQFQLALLDPNGNSTSGITRTSTSIDDVCHRNSSQRVSIMPAWNREIYMNIWVCDVGDVELGYAYLPNTANANEDGIVIGTNYFGTIGTATHPYNLGRTLTHEIGHFFNLLHIWGVVPNSQGFYCDSDDNVMDTPNQAEELYDCPSSNFSCNSNDMLSNFLGYIDDRCMGNFTEGQKQRMRDGLSMMRDSLLYGLNLGLVGMDEFSRLKSSILYPNPSKGDFNIQFNQEVNISALEVSITDLNGRTIPFRANNFNNELFMKLKNPQKGIYFVQLFDGNYTVIKKLILY